MGAIAGFREIEHTADRELEIWAPDLPELFKQAAMGMNSILGIRLKDGPRRACNLILIPNDPEVQLVAFLSELLFFGEQENLGFDEFNLRITGTGIHVNLSGAPIAQQVKEIKAVTYHNMAIKQTNRGLEVKVVFDV